MKNKLNLKKMSLIVVLLIIALISVFVLSNITSSTEFHAKTIQSLDKKKVTVMELTAATAITSTALAAIPSEVTTPLANQIIGLSSYLLIIMCVIFFKKILLTLTGYITFTFLIPIACLLFGIYLYVKKNMLRDLAIKLAVFGIVIFIVVPISVQISDLIETKYQESINQTIENAKDTEFATEENNDNESENNGILDGFISKAENAISNIGNNVSEMIDKGKKMLSNFIDAVAVLLITSCIIPVVVLIFIGWIVKIIFGISIPISDIKNNTKKQKIDNSADISKNEI